MKLARERGIRYIFTGLSRGQLFETRLDELFRNRMFNVDEMDRAVLEARKVYHRVDDAVYRLLDVSMFRDESLFNDITFVDYFRYTDVELDDLYEYLSTRVPWIRPQDTGRSTNCLINEAGIFVHKKERGFHNYALPYSWDVRLGHKTREEALEELDDDIRMPMVRQMLDEVGYTVKDWQTGKSDKKLAAYFVSNDPGLTIADLRTHLNRRLPAYMSPAYFVRLETMPLTTSGKINRHDLPNPAEKRPEIEAAFVGPQSQLQHALADIWSQVLNVKRIGIHDDFFELGGASIPAVQAVARISDQFEVDFPVRAFFEHPTVAGQSALLEELLVAQLETLSDEEIDRLLAEMGD
jgi:acyl carrier protein